MNSKAAISGTKEEHFTYEGTKWVSVHANAMVILSDSNPQH
jgi:hypothetical protein